MTRSVRIAIAAVALLGAAGFWYWRASTPAEREIKRLFADFAAEFNAATTDGLGTVAKAARIGQYFTPDVVIELGQGSPPIHGRDTLIGMAARLQPRTAAFVLELDDVTVEMLDPARAEVTFTALIRRRSLGSGEESIDAREFAGEVVEAGGRWQVGRLVAVDTLR
jgi:hypothetical protein